MFSQDGRGGGLRLTKPSGYCRATNPSMQSTYADSLTPVAQPCVALLMTTPRGLEWWRTWHRTTLFVPRRTQTCSTDKDPQQTGFFFSQEDAELIWHRAEHLLHHWQNLFKCTEWTGSSEEWIKAESVLTDTNMNHRSQQLLGGYSLCFICILMVLCGCTYWILDWQPSVYWWLPAGRFWEDLAFKESPFPTLPQC